MKATRPMKVSRFQEMILQGVKDKFPIRPSFKNYNKGGSVSLKWYDYLVRGEWRLWLQNFASGNSYGCRYSASHEDEDGRREFSPIPASVRLIIPLAPPEFKHHTPFLKSIWDNPDDPYSRGIYADWCADHGYDDPEYLFAPARYSRADYENCLAWAERKAEEEKARTIVLTVDEGRVL